MTCECIHVMTLFFLAPLLRLQVLTHQALIIHSCFTYSRSNWLLTNLIGASCTDAETFSS